MPGTWKPWPGNSRTDASTGLRLRGVDSPAALRDIEHVGPKSRAETGAHARERSNDGLASARCRRAVPAYLREVYRWAYLDPRNARLLDREAVVSALLWGNSGRLRRALLAEILSGNRVLLAAHVYGRLISDMAKAVGPAGSLDVIDVAPLQAARARRKLRGFPNARARVADAAIPGPGAYDVVVSFFLLHELPGAYKKAVVDALLARVSQDGKVVFIDYHAPAGWHPLRGVMRRIFARLEPFAEVMWHHAIADFARDPEPFVWHTETCFGGLYQKTIASRRATDPQLEIEPWNVDALVERGANRSDGAASASPVDPGPDAGAIDERSLNHVGRRTR